MRSNLIYEYLKPLALYSGLLGSSLLCATGPTQAQTPEQDYRNKCSVCHDGGAGQAPRIDDTAAWSTRSQKGLQSLYKSAISGVANTAMAAKGGYVELSDNQVKAIVDFMLQRSGIARTSTLAAMPTEAPPFARKVTAPHNLANTTLPIQDIEISRSLGQHLLKQLGSPEARLDEYQGVITVRGLGIKVQTLAGVATLSGTVKEGPISTQAEHIAISTPGVRQVVNRMISAALFEWD